MWLIPIGIILTIFNPLLNHIFGELSIFHSYLFAFSYFFFTFLFTCTKRTENARFPGFVIVIIELLFESFILKQTFYQEKNTLITIVWFQRYIFIFITTSTLAYYYLKYNDHKKVVYDQLELLKKQNLLIIQMFLKYQKQIQLILNFHLDLKEHHENQDYSKNQLIKPVTFKALNDASYITDGNRLLKQQQKID
jgi:hypothetical protein